MAALVRHSPLRPPTPPRWAPLWQGPGPPRRPPAAQLTSSTCRAFRLPHGSSLRHLACGLKRRKLSRRHSDQEHPVDHTNPNLAELRSLLVTAGPLVAVQVGISFMGTVDTMMVGRYSAEALGAVGLGAHYKSFWVVLGQGCLSVDGIISNAVGAGEYDKVGSGLLRGLVLAFVYMVPLMPMLFLCAPALRMLGQPAEVIPIAAEYAAVQTWTVLPVLVFTVLRQTLQSLDETRPVFLSVVTANVCNVFLNLVFIWGLPAFGIPGLGPVGSSWATVFCTWIMLLMMVAAGRQTWKKYGTLAGARRSLRAGPLARLAMQGVPVGLHKMTTFVAFALMMVLVGQLGVVAVASHRVAMKVADLTWCISLGIASAATIRTGLAVGQRDDSAVRRAAGVSIAFGASLMGTIGLVMRLLPTQIAALWASDPRVIAQAAVLLPIAGAFQIFDGTQTIASGVLRGLLDTKGLVLPSLVAYWLVGTPLSILLSRHFGLGAAGVWWGMVAGLGTGSTLLQLRVLWRVRRKGEVRWASDV